MRKLGIAFFAVGLILGTAAGYYIAPSFTATDQLANHFAPAYYGNFAANVQYRYARPESASKALQNYATFLRQLDTIEPSWVHKTDIGLSYGRIALIEESLGNAQTAKQYMTMSQEVLADAGYTKYTSTEADLRAFLAFWDGRGKLPQPK